MPGPNPMVSPNTQGPGTQQTQTNPNSNSRSSPGPSDENMKKALAALGLPAQSTPGMT